MISLEPELQKYYSNLKSKADKLSLSNKFDEIKMAVGLYSEILRGVVNYEKIDSAWVDSSVNGLVNKCADRLLKTADSYLKNPTVENLKISAKLYSICLDIVKNVKDADAEFNDNKNLKEINATEKEASNGIDKCKQTYKNLYIPKRSKISKLLSKIFHKKEEAEEEEIDVFKF